MSSCYELLFFCNVLCAVGIDYWNCSTLFGIRKPLVITGETSSLVLLVFSIPGSEPIE